MVSPPCNMEAGLGGLYKDLHGQGCRAKVAASVPYSINILRVVQPCNAMQCNAMQWWYQQQQHAAHVIITGTHLLAYPREKMCDKRKQKYKITSKV